VAAEAIGRGLARSAHDVSDGGLLAALSEMALREDGPEGHGVDLDLSVLGSDLPPHELLLSETPGFVFEVASEDREAWREIAGNAGVELYEIGRVTATETLSVRSAGVEVASLDLAGLHRAWSHGLAPIFLNTANAERAEGETR